MRSEPRNQETDQARLSSNREQPGRNPARSFGAYEGVDTVAFKGRIAPYLLNQLQGARPSRGSFSRRPGEGIQLESGAYLRTSVEEGCWTATVEASLPRLASGCNWSPLLASDAPPQLRDCYEEASLSVAWLDDFEAMELTRVDATGHIRDVTSIDRVLQVIERRSHPHLKKCTTYRRAGRIETVVLPAESGYRLSLYDKQAEMGGASTGLSSSLGEPGGSILRVELCLRRRYLTKIGINMVGTLSDDILAAEHRRRFEQFGLGETIVSEPFLGEHLSKIVGLTQAQHRRLFTVLNYDACGQVPPMSARQANDTRRLARNLGLAYEPGKARTAVRLDYDTARQVKVCE